MFQLILATCHQAFRRRHAQQNRHHLTPNRNFDFTICIDVIRMKSYMDSPFDPTCVPVSVTVNKLNFFPNRYIGETGRAMQERIKEHERDIRLALTQTPAVSEHANETGHFPIVESKLLKLGYLRSKSTKADQPQSGPVREQHLIVGIIIRIEMHQ